MPSCDLFRPSDYTGLMMHALRAGVSGYRRGSGLDMGVGSGVLLATLGELGVQRLVGVDIEQAALRSAAALLRAMHLLERARLLRGSLWEPVGTARFDIVVANLPHFAATEPSDPDRSPYWSMGGVDGRHLLDPFLAGLGMHLADDGVAADHPQRVRRCGSHRGDPDGAGARVAWRARHHGALASSKDGEGEIHRGRDQPAGTVRVRRCADTRDPAGVVSVVSQWPTGPGPAMSRHDSHSLRDDPAVRAVVAGSCGRVTRHARCAADTGSGAHQRDRLHAPRRW
jgi:Methyltransferase small domain